MPRNTWPALAVLLFVVLIDALSPFASTVFLPKPVDGVIDLLWIGVNGAAVWSVGSLARAWFTGRSA